MKRKMIALTAATAIGLVMAASAHADSNTLYIDQSGDRNTADVHQSGSASHPSSGGNDIGLDGAPILQDEDDNYFQYSNIGYGAGSDNDIIKLEQDGNTNWFRALDNKGSTGNRIEDVLQEGNINQARVFRSNEQGSTVETLSMVGNSNVVVITQGSGSGPAGNNTVTLAKISGDNNGYTHATGGALPGQAGINITQFGSDNTVSEASIEGSRNRSWTTGAALSIRQVGLNNGNTASLARMKDSDGNFIHITQNGDENQFDMQQGLSAASTGNEMTLDQTGNRNTSTGVQGGDYNEMVLTQLGDDNGLEVNQLGSTNYASVLIDGNSNGTPQLLTGKAALTGLISGVITQAGNGNEVSLSIDGDNNAFGFQQTGDDNDITGSQVGNGNQAGVSQTSSLNVASFVQNGSFNVVGITQ